MAVFPKHASNVDELLQASTAAHERRGRPRLRQRRRLQPRPRGRDRGRGRRARREGRVQLGTVLSLAEVLDLRDERNANHSTDRRRLLRDDRPRDGPARSSGSRRLRLAGLLHDIGKVGIADSILDKPGPLSPSEWDQVRRHPEMAARILAARELTDIREWVLARHEQPDGHGYPRGQSAAIDIPLESRILAVAESYDAMTSERPYRAAKSPRRGDRRDGPLRGQPVRRRRRRRIRPRARPRRGRQRRLRSVPVATKGRARPSSVGKRWPAHDTRSAARRSASTRTALGGRAPGSIAITTPPGRPGSGPPSRRRRSPPSTSPARWPVPCSTPNPASSTPRRASPATGSCSAARSSAGTSRSARATGSRPWLASSPPRTRDGARYRTFESESVNGDGEVVLEGRYEGVVPALDRSAAERAPQAAGSVGETIRAAGSAAAAEPRGAGPVAGFAAGDRFPELRITPDRYAPHRYAGASLDFTPFHLDADLARAIGLPGDHPPRPLHLRPARPRAARAVRRRPAGAALARRPLPPPGGARARAARRRDRSTSSTTTASRSPARCTRTAARCSPRAIAELAPGRWRR